MDFSYGMMIFIIAFSIVFAVMRQMYKGIKLIWNALPDSMNTTNDYWNDAGDGSGVNYVQMPDGSVRID